MDGTSRQYCDSVRDVRCRLWLCLRQYKRFACSIKSGAGKSMITLKMPSSLRHFMVLTAGLSMVFFFENCKTKKENQHPPSVINTAHLDRLYEEIRMGNDTVGIIHIYSEYPDYHLVGDKDEGFACVDDASRAAIFYLLRYKQTDSLQFFHKGKMLVKFLLAMQADNGYYYNFIWPDGTINKNGSTSKAEPSWWAWRSLWTFGVVNNYLEHQDMKLSQQVRNQQSSLIHNIL